MAADPVPTEEVPQRLLIVATGNITNTALLSLFETHLDAIAAALGEADFVELGPDSWSRTGVAKTAALADLWSRISP